MATAAKRKSSKAKDTTRAKKAKKSPAADIPAEEEKSASFFGRVAGGVSSLAKFFPSAKISAATIASGAVLGLACPGFEQWYLAWFALAPLFLLLAAAPNWWQRTVIGYLFGMAYNLTYVHWYLNLAPLDWLGFSGLLGNCLATFAWAYVANHQALGYALFGFLAGLLPLTGGYTFQKLGPKASQKFCWPAILYLPLLWVVVINRLANAQDLMGVPWTQLEYTQYKQTALIQAASICGGIGVSYLIVAVNVALASLTATVLSKGNKKSPLTALAAQSVESAYYHCLGMALIVGGFVAVGMWQKDLVKIAAETPVAIIQPGINIDMQKGERTYSLDQLSEIYDKLLTTCKNELCVFSEGALPTYLRDEPKVKAWLSSEAKNRHLDMVVGSLDKDGAGHPYNAAYGITRSGAFFPEVYHKRYLVPFGEYTPLLIEYAPEWVKRWTNTPAGDGFASGKVGINYAFPIGKVAPLICFESISPEQTAASCRNGGELLVNISDLAWFHKSDCGLQMVAFSVLRAIESRRYFVFGANTGPAAIIDPTGKITQYSAQGESSVVQGKVGFNPHLSVFSQWYR